VLKTRHRNEIKLFGSGYLILVEIVPRVVLWCEREREERGRRMDKKEIRNWRRKAMGAVKLNLCGGSLKRASEILQANLPANLRAKLHANLQADLPPP
jgi:hypothetical protein